MHNDIKFVELSNETNAAATRGAAIGSSSVAYTNQPIMYGDELLDAAKHLFYFLDAVTVRMLPEGHKDYVEYKRTKYLGRDRGSTGMQFDSGEQGGVDITNTTMNNLTGVVITPTFKTARITIENYSARVNVFNLVDKAREELVYAIADEVDRTIATGLGDASEAVVGTNGALTIFGGDATDDSELAAGDVLTTDLIAEAARYLKDSNNWYNNSGTPTNDSTTWKNGWMNTVDSPHVLFIGPAQEMALRKDSQFVNASEYGSDEVVLNGEIGKYLGIKIVVTNNIETTAAAGTAPDGETADVSQTRCILCVPKKAYSFVWGLAPQISVTPLPWQASQTIVLETAYAGSVVHGDAIIKIDVSDQ
jgi:N4-gp56 family major capsid protein